MKTFGPHLVGDLYGCDERIRDGRFIYDFLKELTEFIGLTPIGSPHLDLYSGPHPEWGGFSATIHIQTSHITLHAFDFGYVFIDIFSCKPFNMPAAQSMIQTTLQAKGADWQSVERGRTFPDHLIDPEQLAAPDAPSRSGWLMNEKEYDCS